jgi:hypothetical protein
MKSLLIGLAVALSITACGGGGGGGGGTNGDGNNGGDSANYSISFTPHPIEPNMTTLDGDAPEHEYSVGNRLDIYWTVAGIEKNGEVVMEPTLYAAKVYLSEDEELDIENSSLMIDATCRIPDTGFLSYCGNYASFRCNYEEGAKMTCLTFADNQNDEQENYGVHTMDMSTFLDVTPKAGYAHYEVCIQDHPTVCDTYKHEVLFNGAEI